MQIWQSYLKLLRRYLHYRLLYYCGICKNYCRDICTQLWFHPWVHFCLANYLAKDKFQQRDSLLLPLLERKSFRRRHKFEPFLDNLKWKMWQMWQSWIFCTKVLSSLWFASTCSGHSCQVALVPLPIVTLAIHNTTKIENTYHKRHFSGLIQS